MEEIRKYNKIHIQKRT